MLSDRGGGEWIRRGSYCIVSTDEAEASEEGRRESACRCRDGGLDGNAGFIRASLGRDAMREGWPFGVSDVHLDHAS